MIKFLTQFNDPYFIERISTTAFRGLPQCYYNAPPEDKLPAKNVSQMFDRLNKDITERLSLDHQKNKPDLILLQSLIGSPEAIEFCRTIAKHNRIEDKPESNQANIERPPTIKQLKYLHSLNCPIKPNTQFEASMLIAKAKAGKL